MKFFTVFSHCDTIKKIVFFMIVAFLSFFFLSKLDLINDKSIDELIPHTFTPYGILKCWDSDQPYTNSSVGSGKEDDPDDGMTYAFMNQYGMITSIEQKIGGKIVYIYDLDHIIELWEKYHRFTDPSNNREYKNYIAYYDYFMKNGTPYFSDSIFCNVNGTAFNGEIISYWSSHCIPPTNGRSKITFRHGVLWQIAETKPDSSIAYYFDMNKIIYLYNSLNIFKERHVEPWSAIADEFLFCTDSNCHLYHPLESLSGNMMILGPPNYE